MNDRRNESSWLRRYRVLILFAIGLVLTDSIIALRSVELEAYAPDDYRERLIGCKRRPIDLLVIGGSPVSEGIDPDIFIGLTWRGRTIESGYSLGLPGGTVSEFRHAVKNGTAAPPKILLYGITASDINDARQEPHGPQSLMTWGDLARWVRTRPESAEWVTRHFLLARLGQTWQLFRQRNALRLWMAETIEDLVPGTFPESATQARKYRRYSERLRTGNGYAPNPDFVTRRYDLKKVGDLQGPRPVFWNKYRVGSHLKYLYELLDWAEANKVAVVLVDMPVAAELETTFAEPFRIYREALAKIEQDRRVLILRPDRHEVGLDDTRFADWIHLNGAGARTLSTWIRTQLSERP